MNEFQKAQNAKILSCYNTDENLSELRKAEILDIEKGGKRALIGEKRTFSGREYIKTADGWKFHGKGTGTQAQAHAAGAAAKVEEKLDAISTPKTDKELLEGVAGRELTIDGIEYVILRKPFDKNGYEQSSTRAQEKNSGAKVDVSTNNVLEAIKRQATAESPKAEESKLQGKVGEKITVSGYYESPIEAKVTRSTPTNIHIEFSNGDGLVIPKEHYLKGVTDHGYKKDAVKITPSSSSEESASTDSHSAADKYGLDKIDRYSDYYEVEQIAKKIAKDYFDGIKNGTIKGYRRYDNEKELMISLCKISRTGRSILPDRAKVKMEKFLKEHEMLGSKETPKTRG